MDFCFNIRCGLQSPSKIMYVIATGVANPPTPAPAPNPTPTPTATLLD